jgi:hypothetical protein
MDARLKERSLMSDSTCPRHLQVFYSGIRLSLRHVKQDSGHATFLHEYGTRGGIKVSLQFLFFFVFFFCILAQW